MKRRKRLTKRQRAQLVYEENERLADSMEEALKLRVPIDYETGTLRGRTSSVMSFPRGKYTAEQIQALVNEFSRDYPDLMLHLRDEPAIPDCYGGPRHHSSIHDESVFINADFAELERRVAAQVLAEETYGSLSHDLLKKFIPIDEEAFRSLGKEAVVDLRALVGGAPCERRNSCSNGARPAWPATHHGDPSGPKRHGALGG